MTEKTKPDYTGSLEVTGWVKKDRNGNEFISLKIGSYANLFQNKRK